MNELLTMLRVLIYYLETRKSKNRNESDTKNRFLVCSDKGMTNQMLFTLTKTLVFKNRTHKLEMPLGTTYYTVHITSISFLHAKDLLALICSPLSPPCKLILNDSKTDVDRIISGTYCHPLLIPHIACWVSPIFALQVSKIVNYYREEEWRLKLQASEQSAAQLTKLPTVSMLPK